MEQEKKGIIKLGYIANRKKDEKGDPVYIAILSKMVGREIRRSELDTFIESNECVLEYYDKNNNKVAPEQATLLRFKTPYVDKRGKHIYGSLNRDDIDRNFVGIMWVTERSIIDYGKVNENSLASLKSLTNNQNIDNLNDYFIEGSMVFLNGAGYPQASDGTQIDENLGKFAQFKTTLKTLEGKPILGWYTKNIKGQYEGIDWGTEETFKESRKNREQFFVGRMAFDTIDVCNTFLEELKSNTIGEPWEYQNRKDPKFKYPILKSYLEFELDRLYYEQEKYGCDKKILYNKDRTKALFNTNLIDKFGHDLNIMGDVQSLGGREIICNLEMCPSKLSLRKLGFENSKPLPPKFFEDINEIVFHCEWDIDCNVSKYEHIIEQRIERFPDKYKDLKADDLGQKMDNAIKFAKKIAQRNYKFIIPMYYPTARRIQLLMPIYLETSYTSQPDFALVLTPHANERVYTPETILGLDEVYQDARLVAKPEESWLNPRIIK